MTAAPLRSIRFRMALVYSAVVFGLTTLVYIGVYAGLALRTIWRTVRGYRALLDPDYTDTDRLIVVK